MFTLACLASVSVGFSDQKKSEERDFRGVSEQNKFEERDFRSFSRAKNGARTKNGSRPTFRAAKTSKSRSSVFLCSETPRKRLLRRLCLPTFNVSFPFYLQNLRLAAVLTIIKEIKDIRKVHSFYGHNLHDFVLWTTCGAGKAIQLVLSVGVLLITRGETGYRGFSQRPCWRQTITKTTCVKTKLAFERRNIYCLVPQITPL